MLPLETQLPNPAVAEALPIWMAALIASGAGDGIRWEWVADRAVHTNFGEATEVIAPFGVHVEQGESVVVTWQPGDTGYTVELQTPDTMAA